MALTVTPRLPCSRSPLEDCLTKKVICVLATLALSFIAAACDEEVISGPGFICDVTNPVTALNLNPGNATLTVRVPAQATDTLQLSAVVLGRNSTVRTDVPIEFTSSDPTVATVDSAGIVHALKPGTITIKAATCGKTATAQITVVAAVVTVQAVAAAPSILVDDSVLVTARALTQTGAALSGAKFTFTVSPPGSATVKAKSDSTAYIFGNTAGTVTVTATGEGASGSASVIVLPRSFLAGSAISGGLDAGGDITCGLISLGESFCWGLNNLGQLGVATTTLCFPEIAPGSTASDPPRACSILPSRVAPTLAFTAVAAGDSSACGIAISGQTYCWGDNSLGQLGDGSGANRTTPRLVTGAQTFTSISVGGGHACALAAGGAAYCWGQDSSGQLGDARRVNSTTPIPVSSGGQAPAVFTSISAGYRHTCALQAGTAYCWGNNDSAQLGNGGTGTTDTPSGVIGGLQFVQISAGGDHTCGIAVGGAAYCWGSNAHGQLGTGAVGGGASSVPVPVAGGLTFIRISASQGTDTTTSRGAQLDTTITATDTIITKKGEKRDGFGHTCGLTTAGAVYCWGDDSDLQLGRGPQSGGNGTSGVPVQVLGGELPGNVTFTTVSAGTRHTCAVGSDGNAYCWGSDVFGPLGNTLQAAFRGFPQRVAPPR